MTSDDEARTLHILQAMAAAMARRDAAGFAQDYAEDIVVWHNNDRREQTKAENIASLGAVMALFEALEYQDIRTVMTATGAVQQHVLKGVLPGGTAVEMPACLILEISAGKVRRIDEYLDPAPFIAALAPAV